MLRFIFTLLLFVSGQAFAQQPIIKTDEAAGKWADSVLQTLSIDERIAQLMIVRLSSIDLKTRQVTFYDEKVADLIKNYNVGGICIFQGSPVKQAEMINKLQQMAKTPLLVSIDAERGVGMRIIDSVTSLPKQMMLGAVKDEKLIYQYGQVVARQCKRMGIHVNYAPVVDVNNNPDNPVINDRSFGEDKYKVARLAIQYMKGMQDLGVMACAKHFPGHGDVAVDSHYDLPVISKTIKQLDSLELYPFREVFKEGIASAMIAHLYIPSIDDRQNRATSLSKNNVTGLLRNELNFQGLAVTDALEMQGVKKFFPGNEASVESIIAGNDMLCLPDDVPESIRKIKLAIDSGKLTMEEINAHCKKVLVAKYTYGVADIQPVMLDNLTNDLNREVQPMIRKVAENAITLLSKKDDSFFPLRKNENKAGGTIACLAVGTKSDNAFTERMKAEYNAQVFYFEYSNKDSINSKKLFDSIAAKFKDVVIGIHNMSRNASANFGLSPQAIQLVNNLQQKTNSITFVFGNAYAIRNFCHSPNLVLCYEDNAAIQQTAADMLKGDLPYKGMLPVTVCDGFKYGHGLTVRNSCIPYGNPNQANFNPLMFCRVDSIAEDAIARKAMPGCVLLVAKDGKIVYEKSYGSYTYDNAEPVTPESVYDVASLTKICATTICLMKLYDEGKLDLKKKLGEYLPAVKGTNKEQLTIENLLLHQAGLVPYIPFYKETTDSAGIPLPGFYSKDKNDTFSIRVAENIYMRYDWKDTIMKRILNSPLNNPGKYVYSDNDFIFLGMVVEKISGLSLDEFVKQNFYRRLSLTSAGFFPRQRVALNRIVPTETEKGFRMQQIRGDVHDPGAAMLGGIAGHAGLFSNAYDIAVIMQMLLNGGTLNGKRYLQEETVKMFTKYQSKVSRRGLGFDKPEKDNKTRPEPYPALPASASTFGHLGFTGTCAWADPDRNLVFVFLSNRVHPESNDLFSKLNVRTKLMETVYQSFPRN